MHVWWWVWVWVWVCKHLISVLPTVGCALLLWTAHCFLLYTLLSPVPTSIVFRF